LRQRSDFATALAWFGGARTHHSPITLPRLSTQLSSIADIE
jgi:hypothetical protein